jgi:DNA primase
MKGRLPDAWIAELKAKVSLIDVARENLDLKKSGRRFTACCPFHAERTPSFSVNEKFFYCFGCKKTGDVIDFIRELQGLSFEETLQDLADRAGMKLPESLLSPQDQGAAKKLKTFSRLNLFAAKYYQSKLKEPAAQGAQDYLKKRGINDDSVQLFQIGVTPPHSDGLAQYLIQSKAPIPEVLELGLIRKSQRNEGYYDQLRDRLVFPLVEPRGRVVGFAGRSLPAAVARGDSGPKYMNSSESTIYKKSQYLYGLYHARPHIRAADRVVIVEGYMDVIGLHQVGIQYAVAVSGTTLTEDHLKQLLRITSNIVLLFDRDSAGESARIKAMELGLQMGLVLKSPLYEDPRDPDEFVLQEPENVKVLEQLLADAKPVLDFEIERLRIETEGDMEARAQAVKRVGQWLARYKDPVGQSLRVKDWVKKWDIPAQILKEFQLSNSVQELAKKPATRSPMVGRKSTQAVSRQDLLLLSVFCRWDLFSALFAEARRKLPEKNTIADLWSDTRLVEWVREIFSDPSGFERWRQAPELCVPTEGDEQFRGLILSALLDPEPKMDEALAKSTIESAIRSCWARFSHQVKVQIAEADERQDSETSAKLLQQYLDLQRKLKEIESSNEES